MGYFYNQNDGKYDFSEFECDDISSNIINLQLEYSINTSGQMIQSWRRRREK